MPVVLETYSQDRKRKATVEKRPKGYFVQFFEDGVMREERDLTLHSIHYAEDTAINWVDGIIK